MFEVLKAHLWRNQQNTIPFKLDRVAITSPLLRFENLMRLGLQLPSGSSPKSEPEQAEHVFFGTSSQQFSQCQEHGNTFNTQENEVHFPEQEDASQQLRL